jgi:hypothetical protein
MNKLKKFLFLGLLTVNNTSGTTNIIDSSNINNTSGNINNTSGIEEVKENTSKIETKEEVKKISFFNSIVDGLQNTKWLLQNKSFLKIGTVIVLSVTVLEACLCFSNDILSKKLVLSLLNNVSAYGLGAILPELFGPLLIEEFKKISIFFGFTDKDKEINFKNWKVHGPFLNTNTLEDFKHSMFFPTVVEGTMSSYKLNSYNNEETKQTIKLFFSNGLCIVFTKEGRINTHDKKIVYKFLKQHYGELVKKNILFAHESEELKNPSLSFEEHIPENPKNDENNLPVANQEEEENQEENILGFPFSEISLNNPNGLNNPNVDDLKNNYIISQQQIIYKSDNFVIEFFKNLEQIIEKFIEQVIQLFKPKEENNKEMKQKEEEEMKQKEEEEMKQKEKEEMKQKEEEMKQKLSKNSIKIYNSNNPDLSKSDIEKNSNSYIFEFDCKEEPIKFQVTKENYEEKAELIKILEILN